MPALEHNDYFRDGRRRGQQPEAWAWFGLIVGLLAGFVIGAVAVSTILHV